MVLRLYVKSLMCLKMMYSSLKKEKKVLEKVRKTGVMAIALKGDVSNYEESKYVVEKALEEFTHVDVLINKLQQLSFMQ